MTGTVSAYAPGRVNLIGEHTDYLGGLALPVAIDLGTTVTGDRLGAESDVTLTSGQEPGTVRVPLDVADPSTIEPAWGRYVAGVVHELRPRHGFAGRVDSTLPVGAGLSSSAALELAVALALGTDRSPVELALACQRAEQEASGVPCGVMDQLTSAAGVEGHALLIDFRALSVEPVRLPTGAVIVVVPSGQSRRLASSAYATRRAELERAEAVVGPLREAEGADLSRIDDPVIRARARHVVTENARVLAFADAMRADDLHEAGRLMVQAHASFRDDFAASTDVVDALVERLVATPGVHGARLTGGGFGGCVVAMTDPGVLDEGWTVRPSAGARLL